MTRSRRIQTACFSGSRRARGVTLLEILIAMMVLSIGLLGLASLFPVGRQQMETTIRHDNAASLGRSAFRTLQITGAVNPENWLYAGSPSFRPVLRADSLVPASNAAIVSVGFGTQFAPAIAGGLAPPQVPLVLDPLFVGAVIDAVSQGTYPGTAQNAVAQFPFGGGSIAGVPQGSLPSIPRITLRQFPKLPTSTPMSLTAAENWFRGQDDSVFLIRGDKRFYAEGSFYYNGAPTNTNSRLARQSEGAFSWFATLAVDPVESQYAAGISSNLAASYVPGNAATTRQYQASVVICHKRDFLVDPDAGTAKSERAVILDWAGGQDAHLRVEEMPNRNEASRALAVKANQWIAVVYGIPTYYASTSAPIQDSALLYRIQWYRVIAAGDDIEPSSNGTSNSWIRRVRLAGRDWRMILGDQPFNANSGIFVSVVGVIVDGVVGVYEKTIVTDGTSMWSN